MLKRSWLLGVGALVCIGFLVACGSNYNSSSDGLVLVGSQGSGVIESFGFNLNNGHVSPIANSPNDTANSTCVLNGQPSSLLMNPAGTYAYAIINQNPSCPGSKTGIAAFKVNSDGSLTASGNLAALHQADLVIQGAAPPNNSEKVSVVPGSMVMDSAGKFLFVADRATSDASNRNVPGSVSVFAIGSGGSITEVSGSPFFTATPATTVQFASVDIVSVAASPTTLPALGINGVQNSVCQVPGNTPPSSEYLYAVDDLGNQVFEFQVNTSSGALKSINGPGGKAPYPADQIPLAVTVDPCDRFVFVSNSKSNKVSAYVLCSAVLQSVGCPLADGSLVEVSGSPFSVTGSANGLGPIQVDPFGNYVYVVGTLSNTVSPLKISPVTGSLTPGTPVATGLSPTSMAIRSDDTWMFITNYGAQTVSEYSITPATGVLSAQPAIQTDNQPWGVAVK